MVLRWPKVPHVNSSWCPWPACVPIFVYDGFASKWGQWISVPAVWSVEDFICWFSWVNSQSTQQIECVLYLRCCRYRFSWKAISTYMSLTLARLCSEWRLASGKYEEVRGGKTKYSRYEYFDNIEEIGKPLKKSESHWRRFSRISRKSESRWRKSNFERGKLEFWRRKILIFPRYSQVSGDFGVLFWHQIFDHVHAWIYVIGSSVFQLLIILLTLILAFQMK